MLRVFASRLRNGRVELSDSEWHHLLKVRRARCGERVEAIDGEGRIASCLLDSASATPQLTVLRELPSRESPLSVDLRVALVTRERFDWVVQKAVELGASRLCPLLTRRTEKKAARQAARSGQHERWVRIMVEALKQSGRGRLTRLSAPLSLEESLEASSGSFGFLDVAPSRSISIGDCAVDGEMTLYVGPEGGWSDSERERLVAAGGRAVALGPRVLRTETAAIAALAIAQNALGDLGGDSRKAN